MDRALRAIRRAAREFVEAAGPDASRYVMASEIIWNSLAQRRQQIASHIRSMALAYGVLLEEIVDSNLPQQELTIISE